MGSARNLAEVGDGAWRRGCPARWWRCCSQCSLARLRDVFLRTLLSTSIAFTAAQLGVSLVLVIRAFSSGMDYGSLPSVTLGIFVPVFLLVVALVFTIVLRVRSLSMYNKACVYGTLNFVVLATNAGVIYCNLMLNQVYTLAYELGTTSSLSLTSGSVQAALNDYTLAVFQTCCYYRGWARFPIGSCSELQCTYAELEPLCSCFVSNAGWGAGLLAINAFTCINIEAYSTDTLIGPPRDGGCGGDGTNGSLPTGLPNAFQANMTHELLATVRPLYIVAIFLSASWTVVLLFADYLMLRDWWRLRQKKRNRNRRRYELIRKRLDTTRSTAEWDQSDLGARRPPPRAGPREGAGPGAGTGPASWPGLGLGSTRAPGSPHEPISPSRASPRLSELAVV